MALESKLKPGQLVKCTIGDTQYMGLVLSTVRAPRRGMSPMVKVEWVGEPPRDYRSEFVEDHAVKPVK